MIPVYYSMERSRLDMGQVERAFLRERTENGKMETKAKAGILYGTDKACTSDGFSHGSNRMKSIYRHTLLTDRSRRETDAEHSWHFA